MDNLFGPPNISERETDRKINGYVRDVNDSKLAEILYCLDGENGNQFKGFMANFKSDSTGEN